MLNQVVVNRGFTWRPTSYSPSNPFNMARVLGQAAARPGEFFDDPTFLAVFDGVSAALAGYMAYALYKAKNPWVPVWLVFATGLSVKALHDISRIKT